jgi:transcriptional regulator with XRE-family HTH domain
MFRYFSADPNKAFSQRLCKALADMGWEESPTLVTREFNLRWRGKTITVNAVRKWMLGESMPTLDKLQVLADLLGVSPDWLRWGVGSSSIIF